MSLACGAIVRLWHEADIAPRSTIGLKPDLRNFDRTAGLSGYC